MPLKIAIVGSSPTTMGLAPFNDPSWEIWGLNEQYDLMPRWDRWFHLHPRKLCVEGLADPQGCWKWLTSQTKPIVMVEHFPEVPSCEVYPLQQVLDQFGGYFTNSISFMIAYALLLKPTEIGLWGVDMAHESEYGDQRASCEYFIGLARGMGIPVYIPPEAELCKTPYLYGFEDMPDILRRIRAIMLESKGMYEKCQAEMTEKQMYANYWKGVWEAREHLYKNYAINGSLQKPI